MKYKLALVILVGSILVLAGNKLIREFSSRRTARQLRELDNAADKGTIAWDVRVAKTKGERQVVLFAGHTDYADGVSTVDEALRYNQAIIASPIEEKSQVTGDSFILTWYKFKILENLSDKNVQTCQDCDSNNLVPPQEFLPLGKDEILIPQGGGSVVIDNIQVTMSDRAFPKLEVGKRYLLLVQPDPLRQIGLLTMGPTGVYIIENDTLNAISERPHPFKSDMSECYNSSVESLRSHVRSKVIPSNNQPTKRAA